MKINSLLSCGAKLRSKYTSLVVFTLILITNYTLYSQQLAFPTATGAGAYVTGGRGLPVYVVTNLNDSGSGSLRQALTNTYNNGGGIITFSVSGTIELQSVLSMSSDNVTIAGHTAPSGGITITGNKVDFNGADNFIVRYVRFRPDYDPPTNIDDGARFLNCTNYIIDHCSFSWGSDEVVSTTGSTFNVTWQNNLIAEGKTGSIFGDSDNPNLSYNLSFHNNLYYNITHRFPNVNTNGRADVVNNVIFNWKYRLTSAQGDFELNHINNYYSKGCVNNIDGIVNKLDLVGTPQIYTAGNYVTDDLTDPDADNLFLWERFNTSDFSTISTQYQSNTPFNLLGNPLNIRSAVDAFDYVTTNVGANAYLNANGNSIANSDSLDVMYLENTIAGDCVQYDSSSSYQDYEENAHYINFHNNVSNTPINTGYQDSNNDGIPDAWKIARGFGVNDDLTTFEWPSGYVGIEEFLNEIDANAIETIAVTGVNLVPESATINIPETIQLDAQVQPDNATNQNGLWASADESIATVSNSGLVTPVAEGEVTITFTTNDGGFIGTSTITVTNVAIDVASVSVTPENGTIDIGETIQLNAIVMPVNATNQNGTWSSNDTSVATVNAQGLVTGNTEGIVTMTFTTEDGNFTDTAEITVVDEFFGSYLLYNAQTDTLIQEITDDASFDLNVIGNQINFRSIPQGGDNNPDVESVSVEWTGIENGVWTESSPIYAGMTDHFDLDFAPYTVQEGTYNFTVTYYSEDAGNGNVVAVDRFSLTFFFNTALVANAGEDQTICEGQSANLSATGGINYSWNTGQTTADIVVNPTVTTTYTVTVSDGNGNSDTDSVTVFVNPSPQVTVSDAITIEIGQSTVLTASGADSYQWNTGQTESSIEVMPTETTTYTVTGTTNGCSDQATVTVNVINVFEASAGDDQTICNGQSTDLTATGGTNYVWNTGQTTATITVNPSVTTTYTVTVSDDNGNSDNDSVTVFVNPIPVVTVSNDITIELGQSTVLAANGADNYLWNTGQTENSIEVMPTETTTYTVTGTINGCSAEASVVVTVIEVFQASAGDDQRVCMNDEYQVVLTASSGDTYMWSTGETTQSITVSPLSTTTYSVTVTQGNQEASDDVTVFVDPNPNVVILNGDNVEVLEGEFITLSASGANTYQWSNGATQPNIAVSPSVTTTYMARGYINDCYDEKEVTVNVVERVEANAGEDVAICLNEVVTLTATGGDDYLWSTGETTQSIEVSPTTTTLYTVTVFNSLDFDEDTVSVEVLNSGCGGEVPNPDEEVNFEFLAYPNPATTTLNVKISGVFNPSVIAIYDITGKQLMREMVSNSQTNPTAIREINVSSYQSGIYLLKLEGDGHDISKKIVIR